MNDILTSLAIGVRRQMHEQKKSIADDFLISGAMPRDLWIEEGPITWHWEGAIGRCSQQWRIV